MVKYSRNSADNQRDGPQGDGSLWTGSLKSRRERKKSLLVIIGCIIVIGGVLGGFAFEGGPFLVLMQFAEFMIIGCSALGALIISAPTKTLVKIIGKVMGSLKGSPVS